jgi:hypothetical protein
VDNVAILTNTERIMLCGSSYMTHLPSEKTMNAGLDGESRTQEFPSGAESLAADSGLHESTNEG